MVRVRKLVLAIAAASALSSGMAQALGLGEVSLKSALNQPLVAEIELLEVRDLASGELIPSLAAPEEFSKAGVDRQYFLSDLKFTPVLKPNGKSVIRVTSSKPVREPYLNFLVEVLWPSGRLLREYTLLLDPPLYSPQTTAAAAPQLPVVASAPRPLAAPVRAAQPAVAPVTRPAPVVAAPAKLDGNEYKTTASDTLWEIARRVPGGSVHQTMLAIQELNPQAFIGGNINRLKSGQVLRLPNAQQITSRAPAEAIAQVAEQNAAWREGRSIASTGNRQLDATKRSAAGAAPAQTEAKDNLQLVAGDAGKAQAGSDKGGKGDSKALDEKLAVTKESLDSTRRENTELKGRMTDLQSQLDKLQRLIQLKDDQLAKLQADLAAKGAAASAPVASTPVAAAPVAPAPAPAPAAVVAPATPAPAATTPAAPVKDAVPATPAPATDFNYSEEPAKPVVVEPAPVVEVKKPEPVAVKPAKPVQPVQVAPVAAPVVEPEADSFIGDLLANPLALGLAGGGALLALLVGLMVVSRRNALKETELQNSLNEHADESLESDLELPQSSFDGLDSDVGDADPEAELAAAPITAQTADVLGEADIYIAYGRFNQAAELLQNAINDQPQRSDLRLKLMEVQAELGDRDGFARQERELREIGGVNADLEQINAKYPAMAVAAVAGAAALHMDEELDAFSLDDLDLDEPAAAPAVADLDDAFDLSLDELDAGLDDNLHAVAQQGADEFAELSLDGDFDLPESAAGSAAAEDDLGFDLSLEMDAPAATAEASLDSLDDLADFSLELEPAELASAEADEDFLLDLEEQPSASPTVEALAPLSLDSADELAANEFDLPADFDLSLAEAEPVAANPDSFAAQLDEVTAQLDDLAVNLQQTEDDNLLDLEAPALAGSQVAGLDGDDDFDFLSGTDEAATKLDLARAYIDMGDTEGARDILDEVVAEGNDTQQQEARELLAGLT